MDTSITMVHERSCGRLSIVAILWALLIGSSGCAGLGTSSNAPSLSEAMREAAAGTPAPCDTCGNSARRSDSTAYQVVDGLFNIIGAFASTSSEPSFPEHSSSKSLSPESEPEPKKSVANWLMVGSGTALTPGSIFDGISRVDLRYGFQPSEKGRIVLTGGIGWAGVEGSSIVAGAVNRSPTVLSAGVQIEWNTSRDAFLAPYILLGASLDHMSWRYRNPVTSNQSVVWDDAINGLDISGGFGLRVIQAGWFELTGEVAPGVVFWYPGTIEGFRNDLFGPTGYVRIAAVANVRL